MKSDPRRVAFGLIEALIKRSGRAPSALARAAGISPSTITRFMTGEDKNVPGLRTIVALADEVGAEISLSDAPDSPISREVLRLALEVASRVLEREPYAVGRLADVTFELYGWLESQAVEGRVLTSVDEVLSLLGPLVRALGHNDPAGSAAPKG